MSASDITWQKLVPELSVSDLRASLAFYTELLGFRILFTREGFAYLELEDTQFMLQAASQDSWETGELAFPFGRGINFQIELGDISPVHSRLVAGGVSLFRELQESWYRTGKVLSGQLEFLVQDPDGYLLRFCQFLGERPLS